MGCAQKSLVNLTHNVLYHPQLQQQNCTGSSCCEEKSTDKLTVDWDCNNNIVLDILAITKTFKISRFDDDTITISNNNGLLSGQAFVTCSCSNDGCISVKALNKYELHAPGAVNEPVNCLSPALLHFVHAYPPVLTIKDEVCKTSVLVKGAAKETRLFIECDCCNIVGQSFDSFGITYTIIGQDMDGNGCFIVVDTPLKNDINSIVKLSERQLVLIGTQNGCSYKFVVPRSFIEGWKQPLAFQITYPGDTSDAINGIIKCTDNSSLDKPKPTTSCHACN